MPVYEYRCNDGHEFTVEQSIKEDPVETCPIRLLPGGRYAPEVCGCKCRRLISPSSFILRGDSWSKDNYK